MDNDKYRSFLLVGGSIETYSWRELALKYKSLLVKGGICLEDIQNLVEGVNSTSYVQEVKKVCKNFKLSDWFLEQKEEGIYITSSIPMKPSPRS